MLEYCGYGPNDCELIDVGFDFLRGIKERMDCVGIPVQNDAYVLQCIIAWGISANA